MGQKDLLMEVRKTARAVPRTRVLSVAEITPELLREIAGKPAMPPPPAP